jgi:hypothetical protein
LGADRVDRKQERKEGRKKNEGRQMEEVKVKKRLKSSKGSCSYVVLSSVCLCTLAFQSHSGIQATIHLDKW